VIVAYSSQDMAPVSEENHEYAESGAGNFSFHLRVQAGCGAHPASYLMGIGGYFPGGKAAGA
jgi:hypothetical protein